MLLQPKRTDCPKSQAMPTPIRPETKNRSASAVSGGAYSTMTRADVNAEDHISANANPIAIALMSIRVPFGTGLSQTDHLNAMGFRALTKT